MFNKDAFIIQSGTWESAEQDWRQVDYTTVTFQGSKLWFSLNV